MKSSTAIAKKSNIRRLQALLSPQRKVLPLDQIRVDGDTQSRRELDNDVIEEYAALMVTGVKFPPLAVVHNGADYWLVDGFHRRHAAVKAGVTTFVCLVTGGTQEDARWLSYGVNKDHGLRRSADDKRRAVISALKHPMGVRKSNSAIAAHTGVDDKTVAKYRSQLESTSEIPESGVREGSDGRAINTANIGSASGRSHDVTGNTNGDESFNPVAIESQADRTADVPGLASPYKNAVRAINEIVSTFEGLVSEERTGVHLADKFTRIKHDLTEARQAISQAEPVQVCEKCEGKGCKSCYHSGFWTRAIVGSRKK